MLSKIFPRKKETVVTEVSGSKYPLAKSGKQLLSTPGRTTQVKKIKRLFSTTEDVWEKHYLYAIEQFAEIAQEVPASEIHHHSETGGLIDHTLEALHAGVRIAQGYVLPPNAEPEQIAASSDRWRFGAFVAIIAHDLGKVVTDIEVVFRERGGEFQRWHPWYGNIPADSEYTYRFKSKIANSKHSKSLHEKASMSLLPKLLTKKAAEWIFEDADLLNQLFSTVSHSSFGGQAIAEIVRAADGASVSSNLGADTGIKTGHSSTVPLHEKLMVSLRKLINDGDLRRNRPGAALWVSESETWVVSKASMEAVRTQLMNEGHKGVPKNPVRLFQILNDHELLIKNSDGDSVWTAEIHDFGRDWKQKLTFLRFKNEFLWPTSKPDPFDGTITPIDKGGNPIDESAPIPEQCNSLNAPEFLAPEKVQSEETGNADFAEYEETFSSKPVQPDRGEPKNKTEQLKKGASTSTGAPAVEAGNNNQFSSSKASVETGASKVVSSTQAKQLWRLPRKVQEDILSQNEFLAWLLNGINRRKIRVNEPKAPVHILDSHVALVTPAIFIQFFKANPLKKRIYEKRAENKKAYTLLQRELEVLDIHQRSTKGQNIVSLIVEGQRSQGELKAYLLNRDCFPSLKNFTPNKAMKVSL